MTDTAESMPLDDDAARLFWRLQRMIELGRPDVVRLNDYYEGEQRLVQLGLAIPPELASFSVVLNWPRVTVDAIEQRLDVVGFRLGGGQADDYLWDLWQYNDLDEQQSLAHTDALAVGRSFLCLGANPDDRDFPLITVESALELAVLRDPATRKVIAALRLYGDEQSDLAQTQQTSDQNPTRATLYLPGSTHWLIRDGGTWVDERDPNVHDLGVVPVVPMLNRDRVTQRRSAFVPGVSEMADIIPLAESASRAVTNAQLAQETHAVPHRVLLGASKADFLRPDGTPTGAFEVYMSGLTTISNPAGKAVQFDATDLSNFDTIVNVYARQASSVAGLPIEYFGLNTQNPPSADGQRAGETRLIKRAERRQSAFGQAWEQAARIALRFTGRDETVPVRSIEAIWRDAGTPTIAQVTDAIVKRYQAGLLDWETAQEKLGETPQSIELMKQRRQDDLAIDTGAAVQLALVGGQNAGDIGEQPIDDPEADPEAEAAAGVA